MRIVDLLHEQGIDLNFNPKNKAEAIDMLIDLMDKTGNLNDKQGYKEAILAREDLSTTGIGDGIAIPHGKTKAVKNASFDIYKGETFSLVKKALIMMLLMECLHIYSL